MTRNEIMNTLKGDYNALLQEGYDLLGVFLFGSQNYGLELEHSDIDVKAIYLSKQKEDFQNTDKKIFLSTGIFTRTEPEGQINAFPPEVFVTDLATNYHTWFEILYTDYYIINPKYAIVWNEILSLRENIAKQDRFSFLDAQLNCIVEQFPMALMGEDSVLINKRLATFYRLKFLVEKYVLDFPYEWCLTPTEEERDFLLNIKNQASYNSEQCQSLTEQIINELTETIAHYKETHDNVQDYSALKLVGQLLSIEEKGNGKL